MLKNWKWRRGNPGSNRAAGERKRSICVVEGLETRQLLSGVLTTYPLPVPASGYWNGETSHIVAGPRGNFWFTDSSNNAIGQITPLGVITEFKVPVHPDGSSLPLPPDDPDPSNLVVGPDGNLWFDESFVDRIGRMTPDGVFTEFTTPSGNSNPSGLTVGADGNLWFGEPGANKIGRITTAGQITEFSLGDYTPGVGDGVIAGPDGNVWFTAMDSSGNAALGSITPAGQITFHQTDFLPPSIANFNGAIWAATADSITRYALNGTTTTFAMPDTVHNSDEYLSIGTDGNLYVTVFGNSTFAKITSAGVITEYSLPLNAAGDYVLTAAIAQGADGRFWYVDWSNPQIGVVDLHNALLATTLSGSATSGAPSTATVGSFLDLSGASAASDYSAKLKLDDGTVLPCDISANATGGFDVSITHTWTIGAQLGTVEITDTRNPSRVATSAAIIQVTAPVAVGTGVDVSAAAGQVFKGAVATFANIDLSSLVSYYARIDWGDGHMTDGTITQNSTGGIDITGANDFAQSGTFTITVTLQPNGANVQVPGSGPPTGSAATVGVWVGGGDAVTATSQASVSAGVMQGAGDNVTASSTAPFSDVVASFTLTNPTIDLSHYHATVSFNDPGINDELYLSNSPTPGVISASSTGFTVAISTAFTSSGTVHFIVKITDDRLGTGDAAAVGVAYGQVVVDYPTISFPVETIIGAPTDPALGEHVTVVPAHIATAAGKIFKGNLGTLAGLPKNPSIVAALHGTINWGDGTTSAATFTRQKSGKIVVKGAHKYAVGGKEVVSVDISQIPLSIAASTRLPLHLTTIQSAAQVAGGRRPRIITNGGIAIAAHAGESFTMDVASFAAPAVADGVTRTAEIFWGDGTHSTGTLTTSDKGLTIAGTHTYKKAGKHAVRVQVIQTAAKGSHADVVRLLAMIRTTAVVAQ